ncbi:MAG: hypothetical protein OHK0022_22480 [Roseiflexaceae bacterium]
MHAYAQLDCLPLTDTVIPGCYHELLLQPAYADALALHLSSPIAQAAQPPASLPASALVSNSRITVLPRRTLLHKAIVAQALHRLAATPTHQRITQQEQHCFARLVDLLEALSVRRQWKQIPNFLRLARRVGFEQPGQQHLLTYYQGLVDVRAQRFAEGEQLLTSLIADPAVSDAIRMRAWNMCGSARFQRSEYKQAQECFTQVSLLATMLGNREYQGLVQLNNSMINNELGDYELALSQAEASLEHFNAQGNPYRIAHACYEISNNALQLGRWEEARAYLYRAAKDYTALGMPLGQAEKSWAEGLLLHVLGDTLASRRAYVACLKLAQANDTRTMVIDAHTYLGLLNQSEGRLDEALADYRAALEQVDHAKNIHTWVLISYRIGTVYEQRGDLDTAMQTYAHAIHELEDLRYTQESVPVKLGLLETTVQLYEAMVRLCVRQGRNEDAFNYAERARSRAFLDTLAQRLPEQADAEREHQQPLTVAAIQNQLAPDTALIAYFTIGVLPRAERMVTNLPEENKALRTLLIHKPQLLIFALTDTRLEVREIQVDPNVLWPAGRHKFSASSFAQHRKPADLHEVLIAPVAEVCAGRRLLHLIPHGPLHHVPFAALRDGSGQHLIEHSALTVAPSATVLLRKCHTRPNGLQSGLAVGYNDAKHNIECAETEAALVADLMGGVCWSGPGISVADLFKQAPALDWLHICGHAEVDQHDPMKTALVLGSSEKLSGEQIMDRLRLSGAHVVLSACTTGLSKVRPGDELFGIPRALLHAGAATVLCTLWDTEDCVAVWVMDSYYRALGQGLPPAQALRQAQIAVQRLTGREIASMLDRLAATVPAVPDILRAAAEDPDSRPFADPLSWAPFVIIGRD